MALAKKTEIELKVGLFVTLGAGLTMLAILVLGSTENLLTKQNKYFVHFANSEGLIVGAKVVLSGLSVGTVENIDYDPAKQNIAVTMAVSKKYGEMMHKDATAEIGTLGLLGDKFITLSPGNPSEGKMPDGGEIPPKVTSGLPQFINKGDALMVTLNSVAASTDKLLKTFESNNRSDTFFQGLASSAKNLSTATEKLNRELDDFHMKAVIKNLNGILEKINDGTGTLGALVNDPGLYDDAKALMGGANRSRIVRNLVRQTIKKNEAPEPPSK